MKNNANFTRILGISALLIITVQILFAQGGRRGPMMEENKEKIKAHKIAFITERLNLTTQEAEKFWPVYNEHEAIMNNFHKEFRKNHKFEPEDIEAMSDTEVNSFIDDQFKHEQQAFSHRKEFIEKLRGVIPPKKILMLMETEKDFKVELMKRVSGKNEPPMPYKEKGIKNPE
jgi:hypothetical protein